MFNLGEESIGIEQTILEPFCAHETASTVTETLILQLATQGKDCISSLPCSEMWSYDQVSANEL